VAYFSPAVRYNAAYQLSAKKKTGVPHFSRFSRSGPLHGRRQRGFAFMPCAGCTSSRGFRDVGCRRRFHFCNLTPDPFHHKPSVSRITDFQSALRDNGDLIGAVQRRDRSQNGPRSCPNPISALFDNRKLRRSAGVSGAGARCRNPERSERIS